MPAKLCKDKPNMGSKSAPTGTNRFVMLSEDNQNPNTIPPPSNMCQ